MSLALIQLRDALFALETAEKTLDNAAATLERDGPDPAIALPIASIRLAATCALETGNVVREAIADLEGKPAERKPHPVPAA